MSLEPIKEMPEFEHDVDPMLLAKLSDGERYMVTNISIMKQQSRWVAEKTIVAHNLVVEHEAFMKRYASPIGLFFGFLSLVTVTAITTLVSNALAKK